MDTGICAEGKGGSGGGSDLTGYATEQWVKDQNYLTSHQSIKTIDGTSLTGTGDIKTNHLVKIFSGNLANGSSTVTNLTTLKSKYSHVVIMGHHQYKPEAPVNVVIDLSTISTTKTVSVTFYGWGNEGFMYFFTNGTYLD